MAVTVVGEAAVDIRPLTTKFESNLRTQLDPQVKRAGEQAGKRFGTGFSGAFKSIGAGVAGLAAFSFLKSSIKSFSESESAALKLSDAFAKFPKLADSSVAEFEGLNKTLQKTTRFSDEASAAAEGILARFNLTGAQLKTLIPLVADFAAKTGRDLPEAALSIGRAFTGNARALKELGINFKSSGNKAKDYATIVGLLGKKVGGFAEKEGKTAAGRLAILNNQFDELKERVGKAVVPAFLALSGAAIGVFNVLGNLPQPLIDAGLAAGGIFLLAKAFALLKATTVGGNLIAGIQLIGQSIGSFGKQGSALGAITQGLGASISGLLSPTTLVTGAVVIAAFEFSKWNQRKAEAAKQSNILGDAMKKEAEGIKGSTNAAIRQRLEEKKNIDTINQFKVSIFGIEKATRGDEASRKQIIDTIHKQQQALDAQRASISNQIGGSNDVTRSLEDQHEGLNDVIDTINALANDYEKNKAAADAVARATAALRLEHLKSADASVVAAQKLTDLTTGYDKLSAAADHWRKVLDSTLNPTLDLEQKTSDLFESEQNLTDSLKTNGRTFDLHTKKGRENASALRDVKLKIEDYVAALVKTGGIHSTDRAQFNKQRALLVELEKKFPSLRAQIELYIDKLDKIPLAKNTKLGVGFGAFGPQTVGVVNQGIKYTLENITFRERGGRFRAGDTVLVGEKRPELVRFDRPGTVIPKVPDASQVTQNITVNEIAQDPEVTARAVAARLGAMAVR